jgi:hypothetical protein
MATEYKLSYTGSEIDAKLRQIDNLGNLATKDTVAKTDLASNVQTSLGKADTALQSYTETDPTVPSWAKASTKPKYTASEVGADASGTANSAVSAHNTSTSAHADIREELSQLSSEIVDINDNAVLCIAQTLTDAQKAQARANIDALAKNQGAANVGKILVVGTDGNLTLTDMPEGGASGDVTGVLDDSKNILLSGNLADGTYTLAFANEDGTYTGSGTLVVTAIITHYSITQNLTHVTSNNTATSIAEGESYSAIISANDGYELKSVSVTMGGQAVSVSGGNINIASVIGDIVITAVAEEAAVEVVNQIPISTNANGSLFVGTNGEKGYKTGVRLSLSSGGETTSSASNYEVTGFIPVKNGDVIRIKNIDLTNENSTNVVAYDSNKNPIKSGSTHGTSLYNAFVTNGLEANGVYTSTVSDHWSNSFDEGMGLAFIRIGSKSITADSILTVNQEIV